MIWPLECSRAKQKHSVKEKTTTCSTVLCKSDLRIISNFQCKSNQSGNTTETQTCVPFQSCVQISQWYDLLTSQTMPDFQFFHCRSLTAASLRSCSAGAFANWIIMIHLAIASTEQLSLSYYKTGRSLQKELQSKSRPFSASAGKQHALHILLSLKGLRSQLASPFWHNEGCSLAMQTL